MGDRGTQTHHKAETKTERTQHTIFDKDVTWTVLCYGVMVTWVYSLSPQPHHKAVAATILSGPPKGFNSQDKVGVSSEFTPKGSITPLRVHCTDCVEGWWRVVEVGAYDNGNVIKVYSVNPEVLVLIAQVNHLSITQHQCVTNPWIWLWIISNKLHPEVQLFVFLTEYRKKCVLLALLLFFCFVYVFFFWLSVNLCE